VCGKLPTQAPIWPTEAEAGPSHLGGSQRLDGGGQQLSPSSWFRPLGDSSVQILSEDADRIFCRAWRRGAEGEPDVVLTVRPASEHPTSASLDRLAHEYSLKDELDSTWAVRPLELGRDRGRAMLVLEDPGGEPLDRLLGVPIEVGRFLRLAIGIVAALGKAHQRGLVHKDLKPANILVNHATGEVRLTGFGIASRLPRERQVPEPPEVIAGTLAYMAPEQTGRMNRSIDARTDLYALGITFYQMLTGSLPFTAADPVEWVHCHIARKPVPPNERLENVPAAVSAMIMKLLAKTAEERYQTASGVERDLRRCLAEWEARATIDNFPLGQQDTPDRLRIPEKLYGRAREVETLLASFDRVFRTGAPELVLISGYSGIGKSSVVNELHKMLVPPRGLFAAGKFDQYKRDIPYSTLAQALQSLVRPLLGKSDTELSGWRDALLEALSPNGRLMVDVVPELKLIIGEQPPVPELPARDAQRRFQLVFRRFIDVFARPEHPLALFLDDLQWLDGATLDLLEDLLTRSDLQYLMLIGAYRDNEITAAHPLMRKIETIKAAGAKMAEIRLPPLAQEHLGQLIADALRCEVEGAEPLARLMQDKTDGNPFFAIQFISSLAEEGMLAFDHDASRWRWDLDRIHAKGYTDNVVELLVGKLGRLPAKTQTALHQLACLGNAADITMLALVLGTSETDAKAALWDAVRQELVEQQGDSFKFVHDRVQEAAYSLLPERLRAEAHLGIGRLLVANLSVEGLEDAIFDIVSQLNRGAALIAAQVEREQVAALNLIAGKRAKASTAYAPALKYLTMAAALLPEDAWERRHDLFFAAELLRAECEFLSGELAAAENRLAMLSTRAADTVERARVACLRMDVYTTLGQSSRAVPIGLDYLRHLGIEWSPHPTAEEARREYDRIWSQLGGRAVEELIKLPLMTDPASLATLDVLIKLWPPASFTNMNLLFLTLSKAVNLSIERGNSDASCAAYVRLGTLAGALLGDYKAAFRFGRLGYDLVEERGLKGFQSRTSMMFGSLVLPWTRHVKTGRDFIRRAFAGASKIGDLTYAAYSCMHLNTNMIVAGDPLVEVQHEAEDGLAFAQKMQFGLVIDIIAAQLGLVKTLRGLTPKFGSLDDEQFDERRMEHRFASNPDLAYAECWYWIRKLQARFLADDFAAAVDASVQAQRSLWTLLSTLEVAEYHFYSALARAAFCDSVSVDHRGQHLEALADHHRQIEIWTEHCRDNFENRAALVAAEIARLESRDADAMRLYQQAIRSARANSFVQNEALAYELAARFYAARGFDDIAHLYLGNARHCYLRWGADGRVRRLNELYPYLRKEERVPGPTTTIGVPVEHLDLATVIKLSQAVSGTMVRQRLLITIMRIAMAQAGAERSLLIISHGAEPRIEAEATINGETVGVELRDEAVVQTLLPESVLHYVLRTRESIILDDAVSDSSFAGDPYIRQRQARSILCLPLINQTKLIGVLYLENNLASHIFVPTRIPVLKLLSAQAAVSLENTRLYRDLEQREAKIRHLIDANIIGICIWTIEGLVIDANDEFLRIVGYDRDDLVSGRVHRSILTPVEWRDRTVGAVEEMETTGAIQPFEKEYLRKDGSRVPVLIGAAAFGQGRDQGVSFVLDLTERKRAEAEVRESERRYREVQMELAHANRVATTGQLTASIAHEVNQPIAAAVTNAQAALRWLGARSPDLEEVRQALTRIVKDGNRAGDIIGRIRDLVKKAPPQKDRLDINAAICEVMELTRGEAVKNGVSIHTDLMEGLPMIHGDRVQLQQVVLNLIINAIEALSGVSEGLRELLISTAKDGSGGVIVSVWDSGPGISPAIHERLFDAFYTSKPSGLGLGLSICRSIIEAHGGRLWASADVPRGAVFQFTVPDYPDGAS
jgi:PAS domain S-box-containing protein